MQKEHSTIAFYVDMIYRLQMKRIAAGYTQEELSFLLGYPPDQVSRIEAFDTDALVLLTDLSRLALIFDCTLLSLTPGYPISQQKIEILTDYDQDSFRNYYTVYRVNAGKPNELLYKIMEDKIDYTRQNENVDAITVRLQALMEKLIGDGYFTKGAEAWDIYMDSQEQIKQRYPPRLLQRVIQSYVLGDLLRLNSRQEENRITYYNKNGSGR
ncbi:helix-turn-helix domain-containing protein [Mucilaginibacter paludis]|uniref:Helix-turn-helix domain protein n=1 Tax=Mucilaginibacter paludis DSM 18603 TaxID=714943 RepID=H1Y3Z1_9SPHI|nr:helix-turn-helix transcriptional regulator [Mucilaginibacter paludis]EHQ30936.1 helix-turn-helix domain protein [Mucilaginibacter paludis DSM 18603]